MKKLITVLLVVFTLTLATACAKPADINLTLIPESADSTENQGNLYKDTTPEEKKLYEISDIMNQGASDIEDKDSIASRNAIPMELTQIAVSLYGSEGLSIPFTANELIEAADTQLASYFYSDGTGTYAIIYPAGSAPTENSQVLLYYNTEEKENLDFMKIDGLILTGLNTMPAGSVLINNMDFTQDSYKSLISLSNGLCSGFSSKTYDDDGEDTPYRIFRFGCPEAAYNMDALVSIDKDAYSVTGITIK